MISTGGEKLAGAGKGRTCWSKKGDGITEGFIAHTILLRICSVGAQKVLWSDFAFLVDNKAIKLAAVYKSKDKKDEKHHILSEFFLKLRKVPPDCRSCDVLWKSRDLLYPQSDVKLKTRKILR